MRALAALSAACVLLTACGGGTGPGDRTWHENLRGLVAQLRADVAAVEQVSPSQGLSSQYALLVAYSDLGGCSRMVAATGAPVAATRPLARACPQLERAAGLYSRAESTHGGALLARAAQVARGADGQLVRAQLAAR